jgi:gamma-glutamylcyclotransferase (GGCT)/AIG2-like uncharacterized protein YtfP
MPEKLFRLFAYGTLKRGCVNHDAFCRGAVSVQEASVCGKLYELAGGVPVLNVPNELILAEGTNDIVSDLDLQSGLRATAFHIDCFPFVDPSYEDGWGTVHGELITFDDPGDRIRAIDDLEGLGFDSGGLYRRVLLPVLVDGSSMIAAWAYVLGTIDESLRAIPGGSWPC